MVLHFLKATLLAAALTLLLTFFTMLWINYSVRRKDRIESWGVTVTGASRFVITLYVACLVLFWFLLGHHR